METVFQNQLERIDRLMRIVEADDPYEIMRGLSFYDVLIFGCQSMWHLKDWILHDPHFGAANTETLSRDIHSTRCLLVCADIANGTKHLSLNRQKTGSRLSEREGLCVSRGMFQELYYVLCDDPADEFHNMEIRTLLRHCRNAWDGIINRHYLAVSSQHPTS